jgi:hypothetical protein
MREEEVSGFKQRLEKIGWSDKMSGIPACSEMS